MEFRVNKDVKTRDSLINNIRSEIQIVTAKRVELISAREYSANGDGSASYVYCGIVAAPGRWRVVGIGGIVSTDGHDQTAEIGQWGYEISDLGATDYDAFGQVTMDNDAGDAWNDGEILYQGIAPYDDFFGFDALGDAVDTWDIAGEGAGVLMGDWQSKSASLRFSKANVANSDAKIMPFFLVEYEAGGGVEK
jgi:hypothetical protein